MKEELGLDHFEGRSWRGFHHHATLVLLAFGFGGQSCRDPTAHDLAPGRRHAQAIGTAQALDVALAHAPSFLA